MSSRHRNSLEISFEEKEVEFSDGYERELVCPHCGSNYLHHYGFTDYERKEDEKFNSIVDCGAVLFNEDGTKHAVFGRGNSGPELGGYLQVFSDLDGFRNPSARRGRHRYKILLRRMPPYFFAVHCPAQRLFSDVLESCKNEAAKSGRYKTENNKAQVALYCIKAR